MKTVIVTGSSEGIGRGIAVLFASKGYAVTITARSVPKLEETKAECIKAGAKPENILIVSGDLTSQETVDKLVDETISKFGSIDVLVNNAGFCIMASVATAPLEIFDKQFDLNFRSVHRLVVKALPHITKVKGNIVNISSIGATLSFPGSGFYGISKAALDAYTKVLSLEVAHTGVRVNTVSPGLILTDFASNNSVVPEAIKDQMFDMHIKLTPVQRIGTPEDIAHAVYFLASDQSSFTTGLIMNVDGGRLVGTTHPQQ